VINLTIGLALGMAAGYLRGWVDDVVQFVIGTLNSIPQIPLLLIISVLFQPGPVSLVLGHRGQTDTLHESSRAERLSPETAT